jgi:hypothetical protein
MRVGLKKIRATSSKGVDDPVADGPSTSESLASADKTPFQDCPNIYGNLPQEIAIGVGFRVFVWGRRVGVLG